MTGSKILQIYEWLWGGKGMRFCICQKGPRNFLKKLRNIARRCSGGGHSQGLHPEPDLELPLWLQPAWAQSHATSFHKIRSVKVMIKKKRVWCLFLQSSGSSSPVGFPDPLLQAWEGWPLQAELVLQIYEPSVVGLGTLWMGDTGMPPQPKNESRSQLICLKNPDESLAKSSSLSLSQSRTGREAPCPCMEPCQPCTLAPKPTAHGTHQHIAPTWAPARWLQSAPRGPGEPPDRSQMPRVSAAEPGPQWVMLTHSPFAAGSALCLQRWQHQKCKSSGIRH